MLERIKGLESALKQRIIGQDHAIETLVQIFSLKIRRLDLGPERPNGVFLFVGPAGVGKTETARVLAEYLFGSADRMLRLDMNQFYERHTAARLLGAEFGYVGFKRGSPLLDFVAENSTAQSKGYSTDYRGTVPSMRSRSLCGAQNPVGDQQRGY